jgi:hypothetical protein
MKEGLTGTAALLALKDLCMSTTDATAHQAVPRPAKMNSKMAPQPQKLHVQHCAQSKGAHHLRVTRASSTLAC